MLNITNISISKHVDKSKYESYRRLASRGNANYILKVLLILMLIVVLSMFLPWTQNIRSKGYVTTLNPYDKPQHIQSLIGGKIKRWYVTEGDVVNIGDTIVILTEAKSDYLDPEILANTKEQELAKTKSANAHLEKRKFLQEQLAAFENNKDVKLQQIAIKQQQVDLEIASLDIELEAAETYFENAKKQLDRMEKMYEKGIKSLTDLETKRLSNREAIAKKTVVINKLGKLKNEKDNLTQQIDYVLSDFNQKVAKTESEIQSVNSYRYSLIGESTKLKSKYNQITQRQNAFIITSPINGRITKVLKNGIGEFVKEQENIATIVPVNYQKAVELYVEPNDMPLMSIDKEVRLQFDGWPAMVFSGWPNNSFGTFGGKVFAIDNDISENGRYRILVVEDDSDKSWPNLIRIGSGAQGLLLLNDVRVYYELWRKLNGFPPDFYKSEKNKTIKTKAPIRKIK